MIKYLLLLLFVIIIGIIIGLLLKLCFTLYLPYICKNDNIFGGSSDNNLTKILYEIANNVFDNKPNKKYIDFRNVINPALTLTKSKYNLIYPPNDYLLTDKADGDRCLFYSGKFGAKLVTGYEVIDIIDKPMKTYLLDCEKIDKTLYAFDIIQSPDIDNIKSLGLLDRMKHIPKLEVGEYKVIPKDYKILKLDNLEKDVKEVYEKKYKYEIDGLILSSGKQNYMNTKNYKWKDHHTIDFLCVKYPDNFNNSPPYTKNGKKFIYLLYVKITVDLYMKYNLKKLPFHNKLLKSKNQNKSYVFPIQFTPSICPYAYIWRTDIDNLDGKYVELNPYFINKKHSDIDWEIDWTFIRIRDDLKFNKNYYGNSYNVAEKNLGLLFNPFTLEYLYKPEFGYFQKIRSNEYSSINKFHRFVTNTITDKYTKNANNVLDLASGNGQFFREYVNNKVKTLYMIDIDKNAISGIIDKKQMLKPTHNFNYRTRLFVYNIDLTINYEDIISHISKITPTNVKQMDAIVCNFAIHYFLDSKDNITNLLKLVYNLLKTGGVFIFTCFNGEMVAEILEDQKSWKLGKHYIEKKYEEFGDYDDYGLEIDVKLPFVIDGLYTEYLVNIPNIIKEADKLGLTLVKSDTFDSLLEDYGKPLLEEDKIYTSLNQYVILKK